MIAAATPDAGAFLNFWVVLAFLFGIAANVVTVIAVARKQKREVSFSFEPASKQDFDRHLARYSSDQQTLDRRIDGLDRTLKKHIDEKVGGLAASAEDGRERLKDKIDGVAEKVAGLERETGTQTAWLERMDEKLERIQSRI